MNQRTKIGTTLSLALLALAATPGAMATEEDPGQLPTPVVWGAEDLTRGLTADGGANEDLRSNQFSREFLTSVANRLAGRLIGLEAGTEPEVTVFLRDFSGAPAALSVLTSREGTPLQMQALADRIQTLTLAVERALDSGDLALAADRMAEIGRSSTTVHTLVGAAAWQPTLISMESGLPPAVYTQIGRRMVARELGLPVSAVEPGRVFVEPRVSPEMQVGILFEATNSADRSVFLIPGGGAPLGHVVDATTYGQMLIDGRQAAVVRAGLDPGQTVAELNSVYRGLRFAGESTAWGHQIGQAGFGHTSAACMACTGMVSSLLDQDIPTRPAQYAGSDCEYEVTYFGNETVGVASCDGFEDDCCANSSTSTDCPASCEEICTSEEELSYWTDVGEALRGVPSFYQHQVSSGSSNCPSTVASGCGPVAGAMLLAWYDMIGWDEIGQGYRNSSGQLQWRNLVIDLRNLYMNSWCESDGQTYTHARDFHTGLRDFLSDQGVSFASDRVRVNNDDEVADNFETIKSQIYNRRPVPVAYCSNMNWNGMGQQPSDGANCGGHMGLIVGWNEDGGRYLHINTGWKTGPEQYREFYVVDGGVHLYYIDPDTDDTNLPGWCAADNMSGAFTPSANVTYFGQDSSYSNWPVIEDISGTLCDRIGGEVEDSETYTVTDTTTTVLGTCDFELPFDLEPNDFAPVGDGLDPDLNDGNGGGEDTQPDYEI